MVQASREGIYSHYNPNVRAGLVSHRAVVTSGIAHMGYISPIQGQSLDMGETRAHGDAGRCQN